MKTAFSAKIVVETDKYAGPLSFDDNAVTLMKIYTEISKGNYSLEVIDDYLSNEHEPVFHFKIPGKTPTV